MPRILVTMARDPDYDGLRLRLDYVRRLRNAGGLPLLLPHAERPLARSEAEECLQGVQGVLFSGGGDIEPRRYGRRPGPDADVDAPRDQAELAVFRAAWRRRMPVFGVCRGLQLINVALGGDLYQDLEKEFSRGGVVHAHGSGERYRCQHRVAVTRPALSRLIGTSVRVNSHHHQGLRRVAPPLIPAAFAPDGLCEAVIGPPERPLIAVQWHPECLDSMDPLFSAFVDRCRTFEAGENRACKKLSK